MMFLILIGVLGLYCFLMIEIYRYIRAKRIIVESLLDLSKEDKKSTNVFSKIKKLFSKDDVDSDFDISVHFNSSSGIGVDENDNKEETED